MRTRTWTTLVNYKTCRFRRFSRFPNKLLQKVTVSLSDLRISNTIHKIRPLSCSPRCFRTNIRTRCKSTSFYQHSNNIKTVRSSISSTSSKNRKNFKIKTFAVSRASLPSSRESIQERKCWGDGDKVYRRTSLRWTLKIGNKDWKVRIVLRDVK